MGHELEVITGKVAVDHVHMFIGYRPTHNISKIVQWLKGTSSRVMLQEFAHLRKQLCRGLSGRLGVEWVAGISGIRK